MVAKTCCKILFQVLEGHGFSHAGITGCDGGFSR
jgi:hypothetical protein